MFQFRRFPSYYYFIHSMMTEYCSAGFPHSDIHGSKAAFASPWLFADRCVLRRLLVPRHSPCALCSLTIFQINLVLSTRRKLLVFTLKFTMFFRITIRYHCFVQFSRCVSVPRTVVGSSGLEPPTSRLSGVRSNQLSYEPISLRRCPLLPLVEMNGIEPMTPCLQSRCSPS
jgi:hypothetical protein